MRTAGLLHPAHRRRRAFTLIETALALLAIGLGLLALFGLGRLGLQSVKETENDARCERMADAVFETLRDCNTRFIDKARTNTVSTTWINQWTTAVGSGNQIPFPPVAGMSASENLYLVFNQLSKAYDENELSLLDWNPRYLLYLTDKYASPVSNDAVNLKQVTLIIYPDGDTYSSEYRLFQTSLSDTGGLP